MRRLPQRVFGFYWGQGIADDVPALTYYLLLSLGPFALGLAAIQALLLSDIVAAQEVAVQLNQFLPEVIHEDVQRLVVGTRENSPFLIALALTAMLWTSSGAIGVVERVESRLLDAHRHNVVLGRARNAGLGALVALAIVLGIASAPLLDEVTSRFRLSDVLPLGLAVVLQVLGSIAVFAVIYRFAPRSRLRWRSAFVGAVPAGVAIQLVPAVVGLYFGAAAGFAAVRVFLLLAVLLLGLYVMALVMLVGAGLAVRYELGRRRVRALERLPAGAPRGLVRDCELEGDGEPEGDGPREREGREGALALP